ncbi:GNAT family N-acetyltransferase [Plantactinospora sp. KBS50]|uniref:GNAT family N-acetyltransferase n=1 Tax=Plantactinospora sp. KBS50 TaxID=2024580 RepID=UPI000BAADAF5|nr:GNAT family N-acetyltransferase [Plantactinospora sp. KBS50]ASW57268.1 GNAT family N-acetyltransferase [Plantactinospora sp. KBS50]
MTTTTVRPYRPADHGAGRRLWSELVDRRRSLYPGGSGPDPGDFEEYLTRLDLSGVWVADHPDHGVVGFVGLILDGRAGRVEPVVVAEPLRGAGVGRDLLAHVADQARRRGMRRLTVTPDARNVDALRCLHGAGYDVLSAVQLTLDLAGRPADEAAELDLHGLRFRV